MQFARDRGAGAVVTDFSPLRVSKDWTARTAKALAECEYSCFSSLASTSDRASRFLSCAVGVPLTQVDAHNIVPCWQVSRFLRLSLAQLRG